MVGYILTSIKDFGIPNFSCTFLFTVFYLLSVFFSTTFRFKSLTVNSSAHSSREDSILESYMQNTKLFYWLLCSISVCLAVIVTTIFFCDCENCYLMYSDDEKMTCKDALAILELTSLQFCCVIDLSLSNIRLCRN